MTDANDFLAAVAYHFEQNRALIPMYIHLLLSALFPIYTGAHASLSRPSSAAKPEKRADADDEEDEEEETIEKMEGLTPRDAILFPLTAGLVLTGLYFAIKTYGAGIINKILGGYFSLVGTYSVAKLINDSWTFLAGFIVPTYYCDQGKVWKANSKDRKVTTIGSKDGKVETRSTPLAGPLGRLTLPEVLQKGLWDRRDFVKQRFVVKGYAKDAFDFRAILTRLNVLSAVLGLVAVGYSMFVDKPWWLTNLQGFAVCYGALQLMSPTTFMTGTLILSGLFFYDIWAVFFTPLMVTVAKNLDIPIKLVFPRPEEPSAEPGKPPVQSFSMLGLGDIVLPGLMIALALRFDLYMYYRKQQTKITTSTEKPKDDQDDAEVIKKATWVPITGNWGDKFWTARAVSSTDSSSLPAHLQKSTFPKPYFVATVVGYVIGMLATLVFMSVFQHAQPALLYLVPAVLTSLWGTGLIRGELNEMWQFTESIDGLPEGEEDDEKEKSGTKDESEDAAPTSIMSTLRSFLGGDDTRKNAAGTSQKDLAASKSDDASKEEQDSSNAKKSEKSSTEPDLVFSFTIKRHGQKNNATPSDKGPNSADGEASTRKAKKADSASASDSSCDGVLVSPSDLSDRVKA